MATLPDIGVPYASIDPATGSGSFDTILQQLLGMLTGGGAPKPPNYSALLKEGVNSPLLQSVLGPALANLLPGEDLARTSLMDEFRSSGALGGGAMGAASAKLENALQGQRGNLVSQIISQMLPTMTSGLSNQFNQQMAIPGLLGQILSQTKPSLIKGQLPPGVGTGPGGTTDPFGMLSDNPFASSQSLNAQSMARMSGGASGGSSGGSAPYVTASGGGLNYMSDGTVQPDLSYFGTQGMDFSSLGGGSNPNLSIDPTMGTGNIGMDYSGWYSQLGANPANIDPWAGGYDPIGDVNSYFTDSEYY
jgi:hypothetical protein